MKNYEVNVCVYVKHAWFYTVMLPRRLPDVDY